MICHKVPRASVQRVHVAASEPIGGRDGRNSPEGWPAPPPGERYADVLGCPSALLDMFRNLPAAVCWPFVQWSEARPFDLTIGARSAQWGEHAIESIQRD
jgi:hypothetical protein